MDIRRGSIDEEGINRNLARLRRTANRVRISTEKSMKITSTPVTYVHSIFISREEMLFSTGFRKWVTRV